MSREKGRKAALRTLIERRNRPLRKLDERHYKAADGAFRDRAREELLDHQAELRRLGFDPNLIGEHEADPVMCNHCGEPIPWKVLLGYRS